MRWSNLWTDWMGHGHLRCGPGPAWREKRPKVVMTATSVFRTWNTNNKRTKINKRRTPMAMVGFRFMAGGERLEWQGARGGGPPGVEKRCDIFSPHFNGGTSG